MDKGSRMGEGQLLQHLLQEAASQHDLDQDDHDQSEDAEFQLQNMIENYQNHVLKQHHQNFNHNDPNHNYKPGSSDGPSKHRILKSSHGPPISHSQPCLFVTEHHPDDSNGSQYAHSSDPREEYQQTYEALRAENTFLKQKIEQLQRKVVSFKKLEHAYEKIEAEFNQLVNRKEKQEKLEQTARTKMEQSIQRLGNENGLLQRQVEKLNLVVAQYHQTDSEQFMQYNHLMNDLLPQHKELVAIKNRQQIEIDAQNATLEEQRNHIEMLEKALTNAQERLAAKERAAVDAVALVDKCTHQQKLLQEALDDKQKMQEEYTRLKSQNDMELAQLKMQLAKDGPRKIKGADEERLKTVIQQKEDRISQLENSLMDLQKRYNDEILRHDANGNGDNEHYMARIRQLEKEKMDKDKRIQSLLDEKERIHGQWAEERRSLDHRVRLLEQDWRHYREAQNPVPGFNGGPPPPLSPLHSPYKNVHNGPVSPGINGFKRNPGSHGDSTAQKMDELKQRIFDRKAASNWFVNGGQKSTTSERSQSQSSEHHRNPSTSSLTNHTLQHQPRTIALINPVEHHGSGASSSADSTTNSSESVNHTERLSPIGMTNRMATKMPSNYIETLPSSTRRRFGQENVKVPKRTAIALGTSRYRRPAWSGDKLEENEDSLTTVVEVKDSVGERFRNDNNK